MENLWPSFNKIQVVTPKALFEKQVEYFNAMDIGLRGNLYTTPAHEIDNDIFTPLDEEKTHLLHIFRIQVPALNGFTTTIFRAKHKTTSVYPVEVYDNINNKRFVASNDKELEVVLKDILNSNPLKVIVENLISQITK